MEGLLSKIGPICGFLGLLAFFLFVLTAVVLTPGYGIATQFLSELGIGEAGIIFNVGVVVSGVFFALFFLGLRARFKNLYWQLGSVTGVFSSLALMGVGAFSLNRPDLHFTFAFLFFALMGVSLMLVNLAIYKELRYRRIFILGFLAVIADAVLLFTFYTTSGPLMQKISVSVFGVWILAIIIALRKE